MTTCNCIGGNPCPCQRRVALRTALETIRDECANGHAYDIAVAALNNAVVAQSRAPGPNREAEGSRSSDGIRKEALEIASIFWTQAWDLDPKSHGIVIRASVLLERFANASLVPEAPSAAPHMDSVRLDWLSLHKPDIMYWGEGVRYNGVIRDRVEIEWEHAPHKLGKFVGAPTLREALDKAIGFPELPLLADDQCDGDLEKR